VLGLDPGPQAVDGCGGVIRTSEEVAQGDAVGAVEVDAPVLRRAAFRVMVLDGDGIGRAAHEEFQVVAFPRGAQVVGRLPGLEAQEVGAGATIHHGVGAEAAAEEVDVGATGEGVVAAAGVEAVVAVPAFQDIVARAAGDGVGRGIADQVVIAGRAGQQGGTDGVAVPDGASLS
jgi:hypothetical protein